MTVSELHLRLSRLIDQGRGDYLVFYIPDYDLNSGEINNVVKSATVVFLEE